MWGMHETNIEPDEDIVIEKENTFLDQKYVYYTTFVLAATLLLYFIWLFVQDTMYEQVRIRFLQTQAATLTGFEPEASKNFFSAYSHYEKLIRDGH